MSTTKKPAFRARGVVEKKGKEDFFVNIGAAWHIKNGAIAIDLNALPIGSKIILFPITDEQDSATPE